MNITFRRAETSDAEKLAACMASVHAENLDTIYKRAAPPTADDQRNTLLLMSTMQNAFLLVAETENRIVGILDFNAFKDPQRAHSGLFGISVVKDFRGKGIGRKLIGELLKELENTPVSRVELQVFSNNANAIKLYESLGFEHEGRKRRAVRIGEEFCDVLLMAKLRE